MSTIRLYSLGLALLFLNTFSYAMELNPTTGCALEKEYVSRTWKFHPKSTTVSKTLPEDFRYLQLRAIKGNMRVHWIDLCFDADCESKGRLDLEVDIPKFHCSEPIVISDEDFTDPLYEVRVHARALEPRVNWGKLQFWVTEPIEN